jgi:hypothetical protein
MNEQNTYLEFAQTQHRAAQIALESEPVKKDQQLLARMQYAQRYWLGEIQAQTTPEWRELATEIAQLVMELGNAEPPAFGIWQKLYQSAQRVLASPDSEIQP